MNQNEDKEQLLTREVLNKGFDPNDFDEYVAKNYPSMADSLSLWDYNQLCQAVSDFQKVHDVEIINPQVKNQHSQQSLDVILKCTKSPETLLNQYEQIRIEIPTYAQQRGWFFEFSYIAYTVICPILDSKSERRYNDFVWLRNQLQIKHPHLIVNLNQKQLPPVPGKKKWTFEEKYIFKRRMYLQNFLNALLDSFDLKNDVLLLKFLTLNLQDFKVLKQSTEVIPSCPEQLSTYSGEIRSSINQSQTDYITQSNIYLEQMNKLLQELRSNMKKLELCLSQAVSLTTELNLSMLKIDELSQSHKQSIGQAIKDIGLEQLNFISLPEFKKFFPLLQDSLVLNEQGTDNLSNKFKFFHHYIREQLQVVKQHEFLKQDLYNKNLALANKKLALFNTGKIAEWGIQNSILQTLINPDNPEQYIQSQTIEQMLPQEQKLIREARYMLGIRDFHLCCEINRILNYVDQKTLDIYHSMCEYKCQKYIDITRQLNQNVMSSSSRDFKLQKAQSILLIG